MKPELAVLPMDVWADVFVYPWITRKKLAQIVCRFKERDFVEKLQMFLHDPRCSKHTLRYLTFDSRASFYASSQTNQTGAWRKLLEKYEFPETQMPENIRGFKGLSIRYIDDQVLDFLDKIKPLFTNVYLDIYGIRTIGRKLHSVFGRLLPMFGSIREIACDCLFLEYLERHFPETLALAQKLHLDTAYSTSIPTYLSWLNEPHHFGQHEPRFLKIKADLKTITAIVDAVRQQFLAATISSATFVILLDFSYDYGHKRIEEFTIENAATKEQLVIRNACFKMFIFDRPYVEILRNPTGDNAKMRKWIEERAYFEKKWHDKTEQVIWMDSDELTIGQITDKNGAIAMIRNANKIVWPWP